MPELNHKFTLGRMNKDVDERIVPNGEYRDALNIEVATSEGSDVGALQTINGTNEISGDIALDGGGLIGPDFEYYCVGSITDGRNDRIYWLLAGVGKDIIAEYDYNTKKILPIIVDMYSAGIVAGAESGRVLNFDKNYLITGINIVDDFLFWTDNLTEPKSISIERCKLGSVDPAGSILGFNYQTDLYVKNRDQTNQYPKYVGVGKLLESHITVIKKPPVTAPSLEMKNTTREDVDGDGVVGSIATTMTVIDASTTFVDTTGDEPVWYSGNIEFLTDTLVDFEPGDYLVISPINAGLTPAQTLSSIVLLISSVINPSSSSFNGVFDANGNAIQTQFRATIISGDTDMNDDISIFNVKLKQDQSLFKFKFPRFAYRYKYTDGQYSTFSPFSDVAFLPSKFDYLPKEGYNLGMVNAVRSLVVKDFVDKSYVPADVSSIDILYKESNSPTIYVVDTVKRVNIISGKFDVWNGVDKNTTSSTLNTTGWFNITSEVIHSILPSNQSLRAWDNVPRKALAQEIVGNRIVYGNYLQNYDMRQTRNQIATAFLSYPQLVSLKNDTSITVDLRLSHVTHSVGSAVPELLDPSLALKYGPAKTIKSLRTYQLGVAYIDEFGRESPVFSASKTSRNSIQVPKKDADKGGKLKAQLFSTQPEWAHGFKFFIKESSNEYYNLAMDRWYPAQDGNVWLSFPSAERNKVDDETFLLLKKRHNNSATVPENTKYKILAIDNEAPVFIKTRRIPKATIIDGDNGSTVASTRIIGTAALTGNTPATGWPAPTGSSIKIQEDFFKHVQERIDEEGTFGWEFRVRSVLGGVSKWYGIRSIQQDVTNLYAEIISSKKFGVDMSCTSNSGTPAGNLSDIQVEFVKKEVRNLPEFDGRFFVKVLSDSTIKKNLIGVVSSPTTSWTVMQAIKSQYINAGDEDSLGYDPGGWETGGVSPFFNNHESQRISVSNDFNENGGFQHSVHDTGPGGEGEVYWNKAGKIAGNVSSGWFIDKVEAFRPFRTTGTDAWNYGRASSSGWMNQANQSYTNGNSIIDTSYATNMYFKCYWIHASSGSRQ